MSTKAKPLLFDLSMERGHGYRPESNYVSSESWTVMFDICVTMSCTEVIRTNEDRVALLAYKEGS